jgi:hypothetical protein
LNLFREDAAGFSLVHVEQLLGDVVIDDVYDLELCPRCAAQPVSGPGSIASKNPSLQGCSFGSSVGRA